MIWLLSSLHVAPKIQFCQPDKAELPPKGNSPCWALCRSSTACQGHCPSFAAGVPPGLQIPASPASWRLHSSFQRKKKGMFGGCSTCYYSKSLTTIYFSFNAKKGRKIIKRIFFNFSCSSKAWTKLWISQCQCPLHKSPESWNEVGWRYKAKTFT